MATRESAFSPTTVEQCQNDDPNGTLKWYMTLDLQKSFLSCPSVKFRRLRKKSALRMGRRCFGSVSGR